MTRATVDAIARGVDGCSAAAHVRPALSMRMSYSRCAGAYDPSSFLSALHCIRLCWSEEPSSHVLCLLYTALVKANLHCFWGALPLPGYDLPNNGCLPPLQLDLKGTDANTSCHSNLSAGYRTCNSIKGAPPVWPSVVDGTQGGETMVVQGTIGHPCGPQESPHVCVGPAQYGIHSHKGRPARAAWTELILAMCIGISPAAAHPGLSAYSSDKKQY